MNLLQDRWIPITRADGTEERVAPTAITEQANPIIEINAPRADFQGALYQWLIGLLQTTLAPSDERSWQQLYKKPPTPAEVEAALLPLMPAFELTSDGPAFLQDFSLSTYKVKPIAALLIESPGAETIRKNRDLFVKRDATMRFCGPCTATALFTLQTNGPSGGAGHRVGLRGGGPLTTLVQPADVHASLWQKLWLNVIVDDRISPPENPLDPAIFPWLADTRGSDKKGRSTTPEDVHPLQAYWGMPRRIRLEADSAESTCAICQQLSTPTFKKFRMEKHGINYDGPWLHPLTPYRRDPKKPELLLSLKGQFGGFHYRHWLGLTFADPAIGTAAAQVVRTYDDRQRVLRERGRGRLWCFGYDLNNMEARCWYDSTMPLFALPPEQWQHLSTYISGDLLNPASNAVSLLRKCLKQAWFGKESGKGADFSFIDSDFWPSSEPLFFEVVQSLIKRVDEENIWTAELAQRWYTSLGQLVINTFDRWALGGPPEDIDMRRVIDARETLLKMFFGSKSMKGLREHFAKREENEAVSMESSGNGA